MLSSFGNFSGGLSVSVRNAEEDSRKNAPIRIQSDSFKHVGTTWKKPLVKALYICWASANSIRYINHWKSETSFKQLTSINSLITDLLET